MFNIMFWNLRNHDLDKYIANCIAENNIDIAIFAEHSCINIRHIEKELGGMYEFIAGLRSIGKVRLLAKKTIKVSVIQEESRYNCYVINTPLKEYLLVAVHLEDRRNYRIEDRKYTIRRIMEDVTKNEKSMDITNTIIIGDFNANPYDIELLSKHAFNAVLFKDVIKYNEFTDPQREKIKRFYNPIINFLSEDTSMYGSFYYEETVSPYWHCLDQVLVRKNLVDCLKKVEYLNMINKESLLTSGKKIPKTKISDHLPLLVNIEEIRHDN